MESQKPEFEWFGRFREKGEWAFRRLTDEECRMIFTPSILGIDPEILKWWRGSRNGARKGLRSGHVSPTEPPA